MVTTRKNPRSKKLTPEQKEKYDLYESRRIKEFFDIYHLRFRQYYLNKKYKLATMYPCKRVMWRLEKLMEDLDEHSDDMKDIDLEYWNQIKPKIKECQEIVDSWRKAERKIYGHQIRKVTRTKLIEKL